MSDKKYIITFKQDAKSGDIENLYKDIESQGSSIFKKQHTSDIFKFATATLPENLQSSLQSHDLVESIEEDSEVKTQ